MHQTRNARQQMCASALRLYQGSDNDFDQCACVPSPAVSIDQQEVYVKLLPTRCKIPVRSRKYECPGVCLYHISIEREATEREAAEREVTEREVTSCMHPRVCRREFMEVYVHGYMQQCMNAL
jgi:hypothetical protein